MENSRKIKTVNSALWAAYGDILGFPTELVDTRGVKRRIGEAKILYPLEWKRLIGGRIGGTWVKLAAGCYSDDTQLRLATSRAIRADGYFDVESFAKVELPVWLSYCLGAGRGSKVGALALSQRNTTWFSNFFDQRDVIYTSGGGNGAAMRVQPHVWAARNLANPDTYLPQVIQNAICTHGHPRGIAGAVIHAECLAIILKDSILPSPATWAKLGDSITLATGYIEDNPDLSAFWLPTWHARTGIPFAEEMQKVRFEWEKDVAICLPFLKQDRNHAYENIVRQLGGVTPEQRGSGLKCALFALAAAWLFKENNTEEAIITIANLLSSDTDTIATMAGALLGALLPNTAPPGPIQNDKYISNEAIRMYEISQNKYSESFRYPDLMTWQPPRSQLDTVGFIGDSITVAGLGSATIASEEFISSRSDASWQWLELSFGQTILCKRRSELMPHSYNTIPMGAVQPTIVHNNKVLPELPEKTSPKKKIGQSADLFDEKTAMITQRDEIASGNASNNKQSEYVKEPLQTDNLSSFGLDSITDAAIKSGFDPQYIGNQLLKLAGYPDGIEKAIAYAAVIIKAKQARLKRDLK